MEELTLLSGTATRAGNLAYVSQNPWVMSGTLRENITFLKPYDESRYQRVIEACALVSDFALFPRGDQAPVGEAGSNLSGGQRARVALARAMYSDASIFLFDDPLAAVDKEVADHLFNSITQLGRTVVLGTFLEDFFLCLNCWEVQELSIHESTTSDKPTVVPTPHTECYCPGEKLRDFSRT